MANRVDKIDKAALLTVSGHFAKARQLLKRSLAQPKAQFVMACVALSTNELEEAASLAERFESKMDRLDTAILIDLIERRAKRPKESWVDAFIHAMKGTWQPQTPVPFGAGWREVTPVQREEICPGKKRRDLSKDFVRALIGFNAMPAAVLRWADEGDTLGRKLILLRHTFLRSDGLQDERLIQLGKKTLRQLTRQYPDDMIYPLIATAHARTREEVFTDAEIKKLEAALAKPRFGPPLVEIYQEFLPSFQAIDPFTARGRAFDWSFSVHPCFDLSLQLRFRARYTNAFRSRKELSHITRIADVMETVASALDAGQTLVERNDAIQLMDASALLADDMARMRRVEKMKKTLFEQVSRSREALSYARAWPIAPLLDQFTDDVAHDEVGLIKRFAKLGKS